MQVVQIYLQPFRCNLFLKCVTQPEIAKKFTKTPILEVQGYSRSSTLTPKKLVTIAFYDKQHVCAYQQPFTRYTSQ